MIHALCRLKPKGALHLGETEGLAQTASHIPSDTLFSAICCSWRLLFGKAALQKLLRGFEAGDAPFVLSSAFPYAGRELYFPVPGHFPAKGRRWMAKARFEEALDGRLTQAEFEGASSGSFDPDGWVLDASRLGRALPFSIARVNPPSEAGYFFLARFTEEKTRKDFDAALRLLADEGIGGDRSSGCGFFHPPSWEEASFSSPGTYADARCLLSMFYPKDDAEAGRLAGGYYQLKERRGRIHSPDKGRGLLWRPLRLAEEGSLAEGSSEIAGRLVDVTPQEFKAHKVYRCGLAYSLACVSRIPVEAAA